MKKYFLFFLAMMAVGLFMNFAPSTQAANKAEIIIPDASSLEIPPNENVVRLLMCSSGGLAFDALSCPDTFGKAAITIEEKIKERYPSYLITRKILTKENGGVVIYIFIKKA